LQNRAYEILFLYYDSTNFLPVFVQAFCNFNNTIFAIMSSNFVITLETDPANKVTIKTTPTMPLKEVVAQACTKLGLEENANVWNLKRSNQRTAPFLDLSLSVRFANLPSGAKLELVRKSASSIQNSGT
jgi:hypothetical protein